MGVEEEGLEISRELVSPLYEVNCNTYYFIFLAISDLFVICVLCSCFCIRRINANVFIWIQTILRVRLLDAVYSEKLSPSSTYNPPAESWMIYYIEKDISM